MLCDLQSTVDQPSKYYHRTAPNGKYASSMDTSPDYLMPNGGLSSSTPSGTRSGKHFSTRPELVVDGRTLGALENGLLLYVADWAAVLSSGTSGVGQMPTAAHMHDA